MKKKIHLRRFPAVSRHVCLGFHVLDDTLIPAWISNYTHHKVWDKITYPFPNFIEVWEWISNFIPHFTGHAITYPCRDFCYTMLVKRTLMWAALFYEVWVCQMTYWFCGHLAIFKSHFGIMEETKLLPMFLSGDHHQMKIYVCRIGLGLGTYDSDFKGIIFKLIKQNTC